MKKKVGSFLLLLVMVFNLLPLIGCGHQDGEAVTRGEWVKMLSSAFGMDSYTEETPFYGDVPSGSDLFAYVQSASEWGVMGIFSEDDLGIEKAVSCEEVASTAAMTAGYKGPDSGFDADGSVEFAVQNGIVPDNKKLSAKMSVEECEAAITAARTVYLTAPLEETVNVVANDEVVDLTSLTADQIDIGESRVSIPSGGGSVSPSQNGGLKATVETASGPMEVEAGDVFVTEPTAEHPAGVAHKVSSISEVDGEIIIETEAPTLADLYDELNVHMTVEADPSNVIWYVGGDSGSSVNATGVSTNSGGTTYYISLLSAQQPLSHAIPLKTYTTGGWDKSFTVWSGNFEKNWSNQSSSVIGSGEGAQALYNSNFVYDDTPSIEDFGGSTDSWSKELKVDNSFSGGYQITGTISINSLTARTDVDYKKIKWLEIPYGIESASVQVNSDITSTLRLEGELKEELKIATIPIPIAATGLSVTVDLYVYVNASGYLEVRATLGSSAKVEYSDNKLRHSAESHADASVDAAIEVNFGADLSATLDALGIVKIVDAGAKAGGVLTADASVSGNCMASEEDGVAKLTYQESLSIHADLYVPTISVYAGGSDTLIGSLGLSKTWDILTKDKGAKHFVLVDYEWVFWEETVLTEDGEVIDSAVSTAGEEDGIGASDEDQLSLKSYVITLNGESRQLELDLAEGETAPAVVWSSDDPSVATVDSSGVVSPVSTGYTIITAALLDNPSVYVKCAVYVEEIGEENWEFLPADMAARSGAQGAIRWL